MVLPLASFLAVLLCFSSSDVVLGPSSLPWSDAQSYCESQGNSSNLLTATSSNIGRMSTCATLARNANVWIGLSRSSYPDPWEWASGEEYSDDSTDWAGMNPVVDIADSNCAGLAFDKKL